MRPPFFSSSELASLHFSIVIGSLFVFSTGGIGELTGEAEPSHLEPFPPPTPNNDAEATGDEGPLAISAPWKLPWKGMPCWYPELGSCWKLGGPPNGWKLCG